MCAVAAAVALSVGGQRAALADLGLTFDATAAATAFNASFSNPSIPLGISPQLAGPTAQAHLTSLGQSDGLAAFPDLGEALEGAPGVLGAIVAAPVPSYPLFVTTQYGDDTKQVAAPGLTLRSSSQRSVVEAQATAGQAAVGADSTARVASDQTKGVTAFAHSVFNVIGLPGVGSMSAVESTTTVNRTPEGKLARSSSLSFGHLQVPGLAVTLPKTTPDSVPLPLPLPIPIPTLPPFPTVPIPFGGQRVAAPDIGFVDGYFTITLPFIGGPQRFVLPAGTVLSALEAMGMQVSYEAPVETQDGLIGAALEIKTNLPSPPNNPVYNGATAVSYTVGRTVAEVRLAAAGPDQVAGPTGPTSPGAADGPFASSTPSGAVDGTVGATGTPAQLATGPATVQPPASVGAPRLPAALASRIPRKGGLPGIYLVVVLVASLGYLSLHALRLLGVRFL